MLPRGATAIALTIFALVGTSPQLSAADAQTPQGLIAEVAEGTAFVMMRHALAPGTGDPDNFNVNDCSTQRNLSERGRQQSVRIGERLRELGLKSAYVVSSAWCRCKETAELLNLGPVSILPPLNSFFEARERRNEQTRALIDWLETEAPEGTLVMVTHQVNVTALTGEFTTSGEIVVARLEDDGTVTTLGSIAPPY